MTKTYLISGAGIAGLTAAIWLGKAGHHVTVVEKSPKIRAEGYIISLSHKSFHYANELGILPELMARYAGIKQSHYIDRHGKEMLRLRYQELFTGIDIVQIMRDELHRILYEHAKPYADFIFDDTIEFIDNEPSGIQAVLGSGKQLRADVLIGADGLHSNTRRLCFPDESYQRRYFGIFSAAYRLDNVLGLNDQFQNHMEQQRYMCVYTTGKSDLACVFIWKHDALRAPSFEARPEVLAHAFSGAPKTVQTVLSHCPSSGQFYMDPLIQIDMPNWYTKNVVLIGDAAHALTLLSGQGASTAFWGASALAKNLLESPTHEQAFIRYQNELKEAVVTMQETTHNAKKLYIPTTGFSYFMRDAMMRYLPNAFFQSYFRRKYSKA